MLFNRTAANGTRTGIVIGNTSKCVDEFHVVGALVANVAEFELRLNQIQVGLSRRFSAFCRQLFDVRSTQIEQRSYDHRHHGTLGAGAMCRDIGINLAD
jgi:hypothetical protein